MALAPETYLLATLLVFGVSAVFAALGLGGGMLYVPILHWLGQPLKAGAIPLGLLLNGLNTLLAFLRYWREGLVDFRGGAPAALAALVCAPLGALLAQRLPSLIFCVIAALLFVHLNHNPWHPSVSKERCTRSLTITGRPIPYEHLDRSRNRHGVRVDSAGQVLHAGSAGIRQRC